MRFPQIAQPTITKFVYLDIKIDSKKFLMIKRILFFAFILPASIVFAQNEPIRQSIEFPTRSIRRDIPLTNTILNAFEAGTRDFTGTPGPNYWQMETN